MPDPRFVCGREQGKWWHGPGFSRIGIIVPLCNDFITVIIIYGIILCPAIWQINRKCIDTFLQWWLGSTFQFRTFPPLNFRIGVVQLEAVGVRRRDGIVGGKVSGVRKNIHSSVPVRAKSIFKVILSNNRGSRHSAT